MVRILRFPSLNPFRTYPHPPRPESLPRAMAEKIQTGLTFIIRNIRSGTVIDISGTDNRSSTSMNPSSTSCGLTVFNSHWLSSNQRSQPKGECGCIVTPCIQTPDLPLSSGPSTGRVEAGRFVLGQETSTLPSRLSLGTEYTWSPHLLPSNGTSGMTRSSLERTGMFKPMVFFSTH